MSIKDWFNTSSTDYLSLSYSVSHIDYIEPEPTKIWTIVNKIRVRQFYYCSKPSTKRWKR